MHQLIHNMTKDCPLNYLELELPLQYMKITSLEHGEDMRRTCLYTNWFFCFCFDIQNNLCKQHVLPMFSPCSTYVLSLEFSCKYWACNSMKNMLSYCGLVDAKIRASDIDLLLVQLEILTSPWDIWWLFHLFFLSREMTIHNFFQHT